MAGILEGLRVIEGSAFVAAPLGGMTLAQLGAEVIRFDPIGGGLDYRRWPVTQKNKSLYWAGLNKGKRSIAIDLRSDEGRELALELITAGGGDAGIFLTNFPASGWLNYEDIKKRRDDLIMVNVQGHADGGGAVDYTVNCAVGIPFSTGNATDKAPVNNALPAWDIATGMLAATAVLAAERYRRLNAKGQLVKLALSDVAYAMVGNLGYIAEAQINGSNRPAMGNQLFGAFGHHFSSQDQKLFMLVAISPRQWHGLVKATGLQDKFSLLEQLLNVDLKQEGDRYQARVHLNALLQDWASQHTMDEIAGVFDAAAVCWGPYRNFTEMLREDPRCSPENPLFENVEQAGIGSYLMPGSPLYFSAVDRLPVAPAPVLGADTIQVLADVLQLKDAAIGDLLERKVVSGPDDE